MGQEHSRNGIDCPMTEHSETLVHVVTLYSIIQLFTLYNFMIGQLGIIIDDDLKERGMFIYEMCHIPELICLIQSLVQHRSVGRA